jgi:hypothetical protein
VASATENKGGGLVMCLAGPGAKDAALATTAPLAVDVACLSCPCAPGQPCHGSFPAVDANGRPPSRLSARAGDTGGGAVGAAAAVLGERWLTKGI